MMYLKSLCFVVLQFAHLLHAGPAPAIAHEKRAISQSLFNTFVLYEQYVAASYCPANNFNNGNQQLTCSTGNCPLVDAANTSMVAGVHSPFWATTGYVAVDYTNQMIVVSFRGTQNLTNYLADALLNLVSVPLCTNCQAPFGFWSAWLDAKDVVSNATATARAANPSFKILVSGHSFGAAVATLAAADLRNQGFTADLYTLAAPRVCNEALANYMSTTQPNGGKGNNYRLEHLNDLVPFLPPNVPPLFPYYHVSPGYNITSGNSVTPTPNDMHLRPGITDQPSEFTLDLPVNAAAHVWYFNNVTQCYPGGPIGMPTVTCSFNPLPTCTLA